MTVDGVPGPPEARVSANLVEPMPVVDLAAARVFVRETYGIDGTLTALRSERDVNLLVVGPTGRWVLKISHSAESADIVALENTAMSHVSRHAPGLAVPALVPTLDGAPVAQFAADDGRLHLVRLITVIPGVAADESVRAAGFLSPGFAASMGEWCARLAVAMRGLAVPAAVRRFDWDPRLVGELAACVTDIDDSADADLIGAMLVRLAGIAERTANLPSQIVHGDLTLSNVMVAGGTGRAARDSSGDSAGDSVGESTGDLSAADTPEEVGGITGVIDFGDVHHSARICDLAIALASLLRVTDHPFAAAADFLDGYQRVSPLQPAEVEVLAELVLARLVATVLISAFRVRLHPQNAVYVTLLDTGSWRILRDWTDRSPASLAAAFHRICGTGVVGRGLVAVPDLLERRHRSLGGTLVPTFYRDPLHIVRGAGPYLIDASGRRYLDAYNNVPVVGHSHPAVVQAISRQSAMLGVNARYLHRHLVELAERLTATMPEGLDTCILMNSGSEANDLAWRLATRFTGAGGGLVAARAYHGVSAATSALTSSMWSADTRPAHIATFTPPMPHAAVTPGRVEAVAQVTAAQQMLAAAGHSLALTVVDPLFTNAGIVAPSPEFMAGLVDATRTAGGLFLSDEVQAGYGRSGVDLWSFRALGVTPDLVTLGKPMGNGYPVAALITRREIVDAFLEIDEYFSTFGGNPVACAAALTVLDVIEDRGLVAQAGVVGSLLRSGIRSLQADRAAIIDVRGTGLIAGVEIGNGVRAVDIAERMKDDGVLVSTTGPGGAVLKIRPPLIWRTEQVDRLVGVLDAALDTR